MLEVVIDNQKIKCKDIKINLTTKIEGQPIELEISIDKNKITVDDGDMSTEIAYESLYI